MKGKGKVANSTRSDSKNSSSNSDEECDNEGNYTAFVAIEDAELNSIVESLEDEVVVLTPKVFL